MNLSLEKISSIAQEQFLDIIEEMLYPTENKLRIILIDKSFIDIFISEKLKGVFSFHWERRHRDDTIYRYDNYPDSNWEKIKTFPYHFHKQKENIVIESPFSKHLPESFIDFMEFSRKTIKENSQKKIN